MFEFNFFSSSELPHSPRSLTARLNDSDSRSVLLSWLRPFDGNSPLLYYLLELSENSTCVCLYVCVCLGILYSPWAANICSLAVYQALTHTHLQEADIWRMVLLRKCTSRFPINKLLFSSLPYLFSLSRSLSLCVSHPLSATDVVTAGWLFVKWEIEEEGREGWRKRMTGETDWREM